MNADNQTLTLSFAAGPALLLFSAFSSAAVLAADSSPADPPAAASAAPSLVEILSSSDASLSPAVRARLARMTQQQLAILSNRVPDGLEERELWAARWRERQIYPAWRMNWQVVGVVPSGASMSARGVISADQRRVQFSGAPMFMGFDGRNGRIPGIEAASPAVRVPPRVKWNGMRTVVE